MKQQFRPHQHNEKIICFDFDGTLTEGDNFPEILGLDKEMVKLVNDLYYDGYYIIINSARDTLYYEQIKFALESADVKYNQLSLKCKPTADVYIDDKGLYATPSILRTLIDFYFCDDDDDLYKKIASEGFTNPVMKNIANVPENPTYFEADPTKFMTILPVSGGMDSTTLWRMLEESGREFVPVYVNMGQEYADIELKTVRRLFPDKEIREIKLDVRFKQYKHILVGRNALIILALAQLFKEWNMWGEIWFGNLQGESPIVGGDKSLRFFNDMQQLLVLMGYDVRIMNPLIGLDKPDEVAYWMSRDIELFKQTKSCFDPEVHQCGKCQTCFRKYVAFQIHGVDITDQFEEIDFSEHIKKYNVKMKEALVKKDFSHYSPSRIEKTLAVIEQLEAQK